MTNFDGDDVDDVDPKHLAPLHIDADGLHQLINDLTGALHEYIDVAVGIRAEFDAATSEDDPRIDAVEDRVGEINAQIADRFESELGFVSAHTNEMWDADTEQEDPTDDVESLSGSVFEMGFLVVPTSSTASVDSAFALVESGGQRIADHLAAIGFEVQEWGASRSYIEEGTGENDTDSDAGHDDD